MKTPNLVKTNRLVIGIALALIVLAVWSRFVPHPANMTALTAVSLFGAAVLPRKVALVVPLGAIIVSDLMIGMHSLVWATWGSFALIAWLGYYLRTRLKPVSIMLASIAGSVLFYIVTNFAVWMQGQMYAMTWQGLIQCYYNALPFFRNMLAGDLIYSAVLFGLYAIAVELSRQRIQFASKH